MLDPQATSVLISAVASSCTFSSAVDFIISKSGGLTSSNSSKMNEKWKHMVERGCVKSLSNMDSSVWWHSDHPKTLKTNGVNRCLEAHDPRIIELVRVEKASKTLESKRFPSTAEPTTNPCHTNSSFKALYPPPWAAGAGST